MKRTQGSMKKRGRKPKLGSGTRFKNLTSTLVKKGKSPDQAKRLAAFIGRKKYGGKKMSTLSRKGRKR